MYQRSRIVDWEAKNQELQLKNCELDSLTKLLWDEKDAKDVPDAEWKAKNPTRFANSHLLRNPDGSKYSSDEVRQVEDEFLPVAIAVMLQKIPVDSFPDKKLSFQFLKGHPHVIQLGCQSLVSSDSRSGLCYNNWKAKKLIQNYIANRNDARRKKERKGLSRARNQADRTNTLPEVEIISNLHTQGALHQISTQTSLPSQPFKVQSRANPQFKMSVESETTTGLSALANVAIEIDLSPTGLFSTRLPSVPRVTELLQLIRELEDLNFPSQPAHPALEHIIRQLSTAQDNPDDEDHGDFMFLHDVLSLNWRTHTKIYDSLGLGRSIIISRTSSLQISKTPEATQVQKENGGKSLLDAYAPQVVEMLLTTLYEEHAKRVLGKKLKTRTAMSNVSGSNVNTFEKKASETSVTTQEGSTTAVLMESKQDRVVEPEGKKKWVIKLKVPPSDGMNEIKKSNRRLKILLFCSRTKILVGPESPTTVLSGTFLMQRSGSFSV
ncbi:hypothetical protein BT69DRAFT_1291724 [Atractiella rhizophila]|nr:hypothetical protein BT69DRAFT_1291724 [Atractiella rhizophila]